MIHQLSSEIADYLFYRKIITIDNYDVYCYGLEMIISTILGFVLIMICGVLTDSFVHSLLFYFLFVTLRMYTGGYHADTHLTCKATLCLSFLAAEALSRYLCNFSQYIIYWIITIICLFNIISVLIISPVECHAKPVTEKVKAKNRKKSILLYVLISLLEIVILRMSYIELSMFISIVMANVVVLMYIGKIKEERRASNL